MPSRRTIATVSAAVAAVAAVAALAGLVAAVTSGRLAVGVDGPARIAATTTTTTTAAPGPLAVHITEVHANHTSPPDAATLTAVAATLDGWITDGLVAPLATGAPARRLATWFTAPAAARLNHDTDAAVLTTPRLGAEAAVVHPQYLAANLNTMAGPDGRLAVVVAGVDLHLRAATPDRQLAVVRQGELTLVPDGGAWRIDGWRLHAAEESIT